VADLQRGKVLAKVLKRHPTAECTFYSSLFHIIDVSHKHVLAVIAKGAN